jgi:hypothetical protein
MPPLILIKSTGLVSSICFDGSREINDSAVGTRFREVGGSGVNRPTHQPVFGKSVTIHRAIVSYEYSTNAMRKGYCS